MADLANWFAGDRAVEPGCIHRKFKGERNNETSQRSGDDDVGGGFGFVRICSQHRRKMEGNLRHADGRAALHLHPQSRRRKTHRHGPERPGSVEIADGTIKGDDVSFVENLDFNGNKIAITYTGKISGDEIKLTRKVGDFATEELVAKREK